jgi:hypothetical protein
MLRRLRFILRALFFPVKGWRTAVRQFVLDEKMFWPVPGMEDATDPGRRQLNPWPIQWTILKVEDKAYTEDVYESAWAGRAIDRNTGVRCVRCGQAVHQKETRMQHGFDVPRCFVCAPRVERCVR